MKKWSSDEERYIIDNYGKISNNEIAIYLNRGIRSVEHRIHSLKLSGIEKYNKNEDEFIINNRSKLTYKQMAITLNRSERSIKHRICLLKIGRTELFSKEDDEFIKSTYKILTHKEIANFLNKSRVSISERCCHLGLKKRSVKWYSQEEILQFRDLHSVNDRLMFAKQLGVSYLSLCSKMNRCGYPLCNLCTRLKSMIDRCYNKCSDAYKYYGDRGISICDEWLNDDRNFVEWSINSGYNESLSIDRIDNNGPYSPENCRWATPKQQGNNRRDNHLLIAFGETKTLSQWIDDEKCNVSYKTLSYRVNAGLLDVFTPEELLTLNQKELLKRKKQSVYIQ